MYEDETFDNILQRMLCIVPDTIDKREGSIIYDALAPAALELQTAYMALDNLLNEAFADTATREYLVRRAAERGLAPYAATQAEVKAEISPDTVSLPNGTRFSLQSSDGNTVALIYSVMGGIDSTHYKLQCETPGTVGNQYFDNIVPVDYVEGLESAKLTDLLVPGEDEEATETFRKRYFDSLSAQAFGGNIADYKEKVSAIKGVGGVKVYPCWNGAGTVKIIFTTSSNDIPTIEFVKEVQTAIDPEVNHGEGLGIAPVGHTVTVQGAEAFTVNISTTVTCVAGHTWNDISDAAVMAMKSYFADMSAKWTDESLTVRLSQIEAKLLNVDGVLDVENIKINNVASNLQVPDEKIPVLGVVNNNDSPS